MNHYSGERGFYKLADSGGDAGAIPPRLLTRISLLSACTHFLAIALMQFHKRRLLSAPAKFPRRPLVL